MIERPRFSAGNTAQWMRYANALEKENAILKREKESADYWNNWAYPEGATPEDIQNELADFKDMIDRFECVLEHVTGGQMSKATYTKEVMISVIDDKINELIDAEKALLEAKLTAIECGDCHKSMLECKCDDLEDG